MHSTRHLWPQPARVRGLAALVAMAMMAGAVAGCGASGSSTQAGGQSASTAATPDPSHPVGIVAIGHSGLTAENSDPDLPGQPAPENSWATGTSPQVDSVYLRMVEALPETQDHVANAAVGGATVVDLEAQTQGALFTVPTPRLVIIQTIDNDIRCDGTDRQNIPEFGKSLTTELKTLTDASPASTILVLGQLGRPSTSFISHLVATHPEVKADLTGSGPCDFYDAHGKLNPKSFARLTAIIDGYETEQARICSRYHQCHTDGGVRAPYQDTLQNATSDLNHLNVRGQAAEAALMWPVVARILHLN